LVDHTTVTFIALVNLIFLGTVSLCDNSSIVLMLWMFSPIFLLTESCSWFISGCIYIHDSMYRKPFPFARVMFFENFFRPELLPEAI
jgi:hypothetical protein